MYSSEDLQIPQEGYANLTNDYMFKRIFGSEECKDILMTFLNHIIGDKVIEEVTFLPTEHLGPTEEDRKAVFDVSCRAAGGEEFIVEMQNAQQPYFKDRSLFYSCYPVINQAGVAKQKYLCEHGNTIGFSWDFKLYPVRFIAVLNFAIGHSAGWPGERCHSSYHIREDSSNEMLHDKLQFIFLELGRFHKAEDELVTPYDKWMYLFKNLPKMKFRPSVFNESEFDRLFEMSKFANFTADEFRNYQKSEKMIYDYHNTIDFAKQQGYEMGREEGRQEEKVGVAVRMHEMGMDLQVIAEVTGFNEEELKEILQGR